MATMKKPETMFISYLKSREDLELPGWKVALEIPGQTVEMAFDTKKEAIAWSESYEFHCPTYEEVTCNGKYGTD
jgi:hypothetical protein